MLVTINPTGRDNFHHAPPLRLRVPLAHITTSADGMGYQDTYAELSSGQVARIARHYCGITSCTCYSGPSLDERYDRGGHLERAYLMISHRRTA